MQTVANLLAQIRLIGPDATPDRTELHPFVRRFGWAWDSYTPTHAEMLTAAACFASDVLERGEPHWLSILGPSGVGKTHVLRQTFNLLRKAASERVWRVWTAEGRSEPGWGTPTTAHIIPNADLDDYQAPRDFAKLDLVYIEDIGAGSSQTDKGAARVVRDRIMELLQLRSRKWTLLDANLYRRDLEQHFDGRIASRLTRDGSVMIEVPETTPDHHNR